MLIVRGEMPMGGSDRRTPVALVSSVIKATAAGVDRVRRVPPGLVILLYHRVGRRTDVRVDLDAAVFRAQMEELAATKRVLPIATAVAELAAGASLDDAVVVTFDDGTADFVEVALPILVDTGVAATLYAATSFIENRTMFPDDGQPTTWAALKEATSTGLVTVGSHTDTHLLLDRADPATVADDLDRSVGLIQDHLEVSADHFAYPKALLGTNQNEQLVKKRFVSAVVAGTRSNGPSSDPYRLARSPIQTTDAMTWFRHKAAGGLQFEDQLRQFVNRARYRRAAT